MIVILVSRVCNAGRILRRFSGRIGMSWKVVLIPDFS